MAWGKSETNCSVRNWTVASSCCSSAPNIFCWLALSASPPGCKTPLQKLNSSGEGPLPRLNCQASRVSQVYQVSLWPWWASKGENTHTHCIMCVANVKTYLGCCYIAKTTGNCDKSPNDSKRWIQNTPLPKHEKCCNLIPCQDTRQVDRTCHRQKAYHETGLAANLAQSLKHAAVLPIQLLPFRIFRIES